MGEGLKGWGLTVESGHLPKTAHQTSLGVADTSLAGTASYLC